MAALTANSTHMDTTYTRDNVILFRSYGVVVGLKLPNQSPVFTDRKHSTTTTRHTRKYQYENGGEFMPWQEFNKLVEQHAPNFRHTR